MKDQYYYQLRVIAPGPKELEGALDSLKPMGIIVSDLERMNEDGSTYEYETSE